MRPVLAKACVTRKYTWAAAALWPSRALGVMSSSGRVRGGGGGGGGAASCAASASSSDAAAGGDGGGSGGSGGEDKSSTEPGRSSRTAGEGFGYKADGSFRRVKESDTMRALSELSNKDGRRSNANNLVLDDMMGFDQLDAKVNEYPQYRPFCAIGSGGDDFVTSIVEKAELGLGRAIPKDKITTRPSKEGKWVSVKIGPLYVEDKETVVAVYTEIQKETRVRYCL